MAEQQENQTENDAQDTIVLQEDEDMGEQTSLPVSDPPIGSGPAVSYPHEAGPEGGSSAGDIVMSVLANIAKEHAMYGNAVSEIYSPPRVTAHAGKMHLKPCENCGKTSIAEGKKSDR